MVKKTPPGAYLCETAPYSYLDTFIRPGEAWEAEETTIGWTYDYAQLLEMYRDFCKLPKAKRERLNALWGEMTGESWAPWQLGAGVKSHDDKLLTQYEDSLKHKI